MEELVIEKNVPLVHDTWNKKLDALEVDESFIFDEEKRGSVKSEVSGHFHRLTDKVFKITNRNLPKGKLRVGRLK
jgi:hypothetical protein